MTHCIICTDGLFGCGGAPPRDLGRPRGCPHSGFHYDCLLAWATDGATTCPVCKFSFALVERLSLAADTGQLLLVALTRVATRRLQWSPSPLDLLLSPYSDADLDAVCGVCFSGEDEATLLLCDRGCGRACHAACDGLDAVPEGEWFCRRCRELPAAAAVVAAGAAAAAAGGLAAAAVVAPPPPAPVARSGTPTLLALAKSWPLAARRALQLLAPARAGRPGPSVAAVSGDGGGAGGGGSGGGGGGGGGLGLGGTLTRIGAPAVASGVWRASAAPPPAGVPREPTRARNCELDSGRARTDARQSGCREKRAGGGCA